MVGLKKKLEGVRTRWGRGVGSTMMPDFNVQRKYACEMISAVDL